jgi:hypothetical protein
LWRAYLRLVESITLLLIINNNFGFKMVKLTSTTQRWRETTAKIIPKRIDVTKKHFSIYPVLVLAQLARRKAAANTAVSFWSI